MSENSPEFWAETTQHWLIYNPTIRFVPFLPNTGLKITQHSNNPS